MKFCEVNWVRVFGVFLTAVGTGFLATASVTGNAIQGVQAGIIVGGVLGLVAIGNELSKDTTQETSVKLAKKIKNSNKRHTRILGIVLSHMLPF